jgi:hypothetical protein
MFFSNLSSLIPDLRVRPAVRIPAGSSRTVMRLILTARMEITLLLTRAMARSTDRLL